MTRPGAADRDDGTRSPHVPPVLPHIDITINDDGTLDVTLDREPYAVAESLTRLGRPAMGRVIDQITAELDSPIRVDLHETDGSVFTDIIVPGTTKPTGPLGVEPTTPSFDIAGNGFAPGEDVAVAVVVTDQTAHADGTTRLRLPPALREKLAGNVVLVGRATGTIAFAGQRS